VSGQFSERGIKRTIVVDVVLECFGDAKGRLFDDVVEPRQVMCGSFYAEVGCSSKANRGQTGSLRKGG
jgi:hypothetical protein